MRKQNPLRTEKEKAKEDLGRGGGRGGRREGEEEGEKGEEGEGEGGEEEEEGEEESNWIHLCALVKCNAIAPLMIWRSTFSEMNVRS